MYIVKATYKKVGVISLATIIFFTISGGPYGLEPVLFYCDGKGALLLLIVVTLMWNIPVILMVLELNSLMPENGGYYQWVKRALGLRWAFYEGWWSWLYTFIDLAIYPQLLIVYASLFFPEIAGYKIPICLCMIWGCASLNILGIVPVGRTSVILSGLVLIPFAILFVLGIRHYPVYFNLSAISFKDRSGYVGMAIFTIVWNFTGWDNVTTYAGEVKKPITTYLRATSMAFAFIFILYFGIMLVAQNSGIPLAEFRDKGFPVLGFYIAGKWLSALLAAGGIVSSLGLFLAVLLSISRIPEVMSNDKLLPAKLHELHSKYNTPYLSIVVCAAIVSGMILWTFGELLIIDITVYFAGLMLEFLSLIMLRIKEPNAVRPFRIPLNIGGLCVLSTLPVITYFAALSDTILKSVDAVKPFLFAVLMILSGIIVWRMIRIERKNRA